MERADLCQSRKFKVLRYDVIGQFGVMKYTTAILATILRHPILLHLVMQYPESNLRALTGSRSQKRSENPTSGPSALSARGRPNHSSYLIILLTQIALQ